MSNHLLSHVDPARQQVGEILATLSALARQDHKHYCQQRLACLDDLVRLSDRIARPTQGNILQRWQILADVAACDLTLVKWFEAHLDALAIMSELLDTGWQIQGFDNADVDRLFSRYRWAVWAAEGGDDPLRVAQEDNKAFLTGKKLWCSGANLVDYALVSYRDAADVAQLVVVNMRDDGVSIDGSGWAAVGMADTDTATVRFEGVCAYPVMAKHPTDTTATSPYLNRAGFWQGAAGVAACWYGASAALANVLLASYQRKPQAFKAMYLGEVSQAMTVLQTCFYALAKQLDDAPHDSHELAIRIIRSQTEAVARLVLDKLGQALGAAPFCLDGHTARLAADLAVFIRQTHGAYDSQAIGMLTAQHTTDTRDNHPWQL